MEEEPDFELIDDRMPKEEEPQTCDIDDGECEACGS